MCPSCITLYRVIRGGQMPKINVYLPDELAAAVKAAGVPVSPVCQKALAEAVQAVTLARQAIAAIRDPDLEPARLTQVGGRLGERMTARLVDVLDRAAEASGTAANAGPVGT